MVAGLKQFIAVVAPLCCDSGLDTHAKARAHTLAQVQALAASRARGKGACLLCGTPLPSFHTTGLHHGSEVVLTWKLDNQLLHRRREAEDQDLGGALPAALHGVHNRWVKATASAVAKGHLQHWHLGLTRTGTCVRAVVSPEVFLDLEPNPSQILLYMNRSEYTQSWDRVQVPPRASCGEARAALPTPSVSPDQLFAFEGAASVTLASLQHTLLGFFPENTPTLLQRGLTFRACVVTRVPVIPHRVRPTTAFGSVRRPAPLTCQYLALLVLAGRVRDGFNALALAAAGDVSINVPRVRAEVATALYGADTVAAYTPAGGAGTGTGASAVRSRQPKGTTAGDMHMALQAGLVAAVHSVVTGPGGSSGVAMSKAAASGFLGVAGARPPPSASKKTKAGSDLGTLQSLSGLWKGKNCLSRDLGNDVFPGSMRAVCSAGLMPRGFLGVPVQVATNLLVKETVTSFNLGAVRAAVARGLLPPEDLVTNLSGPSLFNVHALRRVGSTNWVALHLEQSNTCLDTATTVRRLKRAAAKARNLDTVLVSAGVVPEVGDTMLRTITHRDVVWMNRHPTLLPQSMQATQLLLLPPTCTCILGNPVGDKGLNRDHDGDCMCGYPINNVAAQAETAALAGPERQMYNEETASNMFGTQLGFTNSLVDIGIGVPIGLEVVWPVWDGQSAPVPVPAPEPALGCTSETTERVWTRGRHRAATGPLGGMPRYLHPVDVGAVLAVIRSWTRLEDHLGVTIGRQSTRDYAPGQLPAPDCTITRAGVWALDYIKVVKRVREAVLAVFGPVHGQEHARAAAEWVPTPPCASTWETHGRKWWHGPARGHSTPAEWLSASMARQELDQGPLGVGRRWALLADWRALGAADGVPPALGAAARAMAAAGCCAPTTTTTPPWWCQRGPGTTRARVLYRGTSLLAWVLGKSDTGARAHTHVPRVTFPSGPPAGLTSPGTLTGPGGVALAAGSWLSGSPVKSSFQADPASVVHGVVSASGPVAALPRLDNLMRLGTVPPVGDTVSIGDFGALATLVLGAGGLPAVGLRHPRAVMAEVAAAAAAVGTVPTAEDYTTALQRAWAVSHKRLIGVITAALNGAAARGADPTAAPTALSPFCKLWQRVIAKGSTEDVLTMLLIGQLTAPVPNDTDLSASNRPDQCAAFRGSATDPGAVGFLTGGFMDAEYRQGYPVMARVAQELLQRTQASVPDSGATQATTGAAAAALVAVQGPCNSVLLDFNGRLLDFTVGDTGGNGALMCTVPTSYTPDGALEAVAAETGPAADLARAGAAAWLLRAFGPGARGVKGRVPLVANPWAVLDHATQCVFRGCGVGCGHAPTPCGAWDPDRVAAEVLAAARALSPPPLPFGHTTAHDPVILDDAEASAAHALRDSGVDGAMGCFLLACVTPAVLATGYGVRCVAHAQEVLGAVVARVLCEAKFEPNDAVGGRCAQRISASATQGLLNAFKNVGKQEQTIRRNEVGSILMSNHALSESGLVAKDAVSNMTFRLRADATGVGLAHLQLAMAERTLQCFVTPGGITLERLPQGHGPDGPPPVPAWFAAWATTGGGARGRAAVAAAWAEFWPGVAHVTTGLWVTTDTATLLAANFWGVVVSGEAGQPAPTPVRDPGELGPAFAAFVAGFLGTVVTGLQAGPWVGTPTRGPGLHRYAVLLPWVDTDVGGKPAARGARVPLRKIAHNPWAALRGRVVTGVPRVREVRMGGTRDPLGTFVTTGVNLRGVWSGTVPPDAARAYLHAAAFRAARAVLAAVDVRTVGANSLGQVAATLGVEAARVEVVRATMAILDVGTGAEAPNVLATAMTAFGDLRPLTALHECNGVMQRAAHRSGDTHVLTAAVNGAVDTLDTPTTAAILGKPVSIGTGGRNVSLLPDMAALNAVAATRREGLRAAPVAITPLQVTPSPAHNPFGEATGEQAGGFSVAFSPLTAELPGVNSPAYSGASPRAYAPFTPAWNPEGVTSPVYTPTSPVWGPGAGPSPAFAPTSPGLTSPKFNAAWASPGVVALQATRAADDGLGNAFLQAAHCRETPQSPDACPNV